MNMISSQISTLKKQTTKEDIKQIYRKTSLLSPIKGQINFRKNNNYCNGKHSIDNLESTCQIINKLKSLNVLIQNRKLFNSNLKSINNLQSVSQESIPQQQQGKRKKKIYGNKVLINNINRMSTIQIEEEMRQQFPKFNSQKDPQTFTDWVEKIYGKQWFVESFNQ